VGFLALARAARELSAVLGQRVDLVPQDGLKPLIRDEVLAEAEALFEE
jgi:predicted nucleotidyltransferase